VTNLSRSGIRAIIVQSVVIILAFAVLFISAGTLAWINAWIYFGLIVPDWVISEAVLARVNPEVLNARGSVIRAGTKGFDKIGLVLVPLLTLCGLVVMGFDAVRFQWSHMPFWLTIIGAAMVIPAFAGGIWAMSVNKFFEWTARVQDDRNHYVCTSGPYSIIRHPGYACYIVTKLSYPLILGSWWGFLPEGILIILFIIRTALEDRALQNELPGYRDYAGKVKYRLIPFIW
jgi:protein-S-isoprenylcysteine O-methyltransferase Ste14